MKCLNPFPIRSGIRAGCGDCIPCRINKRRLWAARIVLEAQLHEHSVFVTLTYDDGHLPSDYSLQPRDLRLFLKRLRKALAPLRVRFFAVGEYGDLSQRPHYHLVIFGIGLASSDLIDKAWGKGFTYCGDVTEQSAMYVCGYTIKKMTSTDDSRLDGRYPEFSRMSNRPGIAADAVVPISQALLEVKPDLFEEDLPRVIRLGGGYFALGRYLRSKMKELVPVRDRFVDYNDVEEILYSRGFPDYENLDAQEVQRGRKVKARAKILQFKKRNDL